MLSIFVVRGVREGDRRVTRCDMVRIMGWDQLIEYLGDVWEELWDAMLFKLKIDETSLKTVLNIGDGNCKMVRALT